MNLSWSDVKAMKLPLWEVLAGIGVAIGVTWAAFTWADDIEDKQIKTQDQLSQLVLIVTKTTTANDQTNEIQDEDIDQVERAFELLRQEMELRRELQRENDGTQ